MSKVIVYGSLNMDLSIESDHMPQLGETLMGRCFITNPGGKGANQAVAAAKLGAEVVMLGSVGLDAFGDQMIATLVEQGVRCDLLERIDAHPTGVAVITRVEGDNFITIDPGANFSTDITYVKQALDMEAAPGDVFLCQLECDFDTTMDAIRYAHEQGMYTVLNPAPARTLPEWVYEHIDLLVVNESECEILTSIYPVGSDDLSVAMDVLCERGVRSVAITLGARGSVVRVRGEEYQTIPPCVDAIDTTCAGDTYIGALVAGYSRGVSLDETLALATEASALATTRIGAQQSIPLLDEVIISEV